MTLILRNRPFLWLAPEGAQACLCLHGLGGGCYEIYPLAQRLHQQGITVQGILYPGHDATREQMPASTWQQWYDKAVAAYHLLKTQHDRVAIVGFSTGCPLGLYLAKEYPVQALVLLSPFLRIRYRWYYLLPPEVYLRMVGGWLEQVPRRQLPIRDPLVRAQANAQVIYRTFNLSAVRSALDLIQRVSPCLSDITCPALILQSKQDSVVDPIGAQILEQQLGSGRKSLHWLHRSDHLIPLDLEREEVYRHVCGFLNDCELPTFL